jgi:hypothetical protein
MAVFLICKKCGYVVGSFSLIVFDATDGEGSVFIGASNVRKVFGTQIYAVRGATTIEHRRSPEVCTEALAPVNSPAGSVTSRQRREPEGI